MAEDFTDRLRQVEREIRASQTRQQADMLPYCQIQGITGARIEGVWFDRAAISDEVWAHVSKPKSYRETAQPSDKDVTVSCTDEPETPTEQIAASVQAPWRAILTDWLAARAYAKEHGVSREDALCGFPFSEGYE